MARQRNQGFSTGKKETVTFVKENLVFATHTQTVISSILLLRMRLKFLKVRQFQENCEVN